MNKIPCVVMDCMYNYDNEIDAIVNGEGQSVLTQYAVEQS